MKITVITKNNAWEINQLNKFALKNNINFEIKNISDPNSINEFINDLGVIVIYRSSSFQIN